MTQNEHTNNQLALPGVCIVHLLLNRASNLKLAQFQSHTFASPRNNTRRWWEA